MTDPGDVFGDIAKTYAAMLDNAKPGAEMRAMERGKYFSKTLLQNPVFADSLERALKRGVKVTFFLDNTIPRQKSSPEIDPFSAVYAAYGYGGLENVVKYFKGFGAPQDKAYEMAKEFEDGLGKRKYLLRAQGLLYKVFGKYQKLEIQTST